MHHAWWRHTTHPPPTGSTRTHHTEHPPHILYHTTSLPPPSLPIPSPFSEFYGRHKFICKFNRSQYILQEFLFKISVFPDSCFHTVSLNLSPNFILPWACPPLDKTPHLWVLPSQIPGSISSSQQEPILSTLSSDSNIVQGIQSPQGPAKRYFQVRISKPQASLKRMFSFSSRKAFCG